MKYVKSDIQVINEATIPMQIERCGKVAYKSEHNITSTSADKFINGLIASGHGSVLEHGSIYFKFKAKDIYEYSPEFVNILLSPYTFLYDQQNNTVYSSSIICNKMLHFLLTLKHSNNTFIGCTNARVLQNVYGDYLYNDAELNVNVTTCEIPYIIQRNSINFICSRAIANEIVRHRSASPTQESTRWCNYGKSNDINFIVKPRHENDISSFDGVLDTYNTSDAENRFKAKYNDVAESSEDHYFECIQLGIKPQDARDLLSLFLKTEIIMTANMYQWVNFFRLRSSQDIQRELGVTKMSKPHEDVVYLADKLYNYFNSVGYDIKQLAKYVPIYL